MYCYKCGNKILREDALFCTKCGASLKEVRELNTEENCASCDNVTEANTVTKESAKVSATVTSTNRESQSPLTPTRKKRIRINCNKLIGLAVTVLVIFAVFKLFSFATSKVGQIDITHGGEKQWISDSESDWVFDYKWAEIDEEWDEFDPNASLKMGFDFLTESSDLKDDMIDAIGRDYIEARLNPIHYSADSYFEFCPRSTVKKAHKAWKKYLKDHKELKKMYIEVNGDKFFPYADDDFDKSYFINESTAFTDVYDDYDLFGGDDMAERFVISMYMAEDLRGLEARLRSYGLSDFADVIDEEYQYVQAEKAPVMGCRYFYYEDDEYDCNAIMFMMQYFPDALYEGEDGRITVSQDQDGSYMFGYQIEYDWYQE